MREAARPYYAEAAGRPSIDPTVLLKLMLAGVRWRESRSMRELLRVADLRLDLRLFLGYGLAERLPAHQTISEAQTQRFANGEVFERLFLHTVALCKQQGLIEGSHLSVDGFHAEANAALRSLRASLEPIAGEASDEPKPHDATASVPPQLRLAEPRSGPTPKRKATNATAVSRSDPDARLKGKPGAAAFQPARRGPFSTGLDRSDPGKVVRQSTSSCSRVREGAKHLILSIQLYSLSTA